MQNLKYELKVQFCEVTKGNHTSSWSVQPISNYYSKQVKAPVKLACGFELGLMIFNYIYLARS